MRWFLCFLSKNTNLTKDNILMEIEKAGVDISTPSLIQITTKYYPSFIHVYLTSNLTREELEQRLLSLGLTSLIPLELDRDETDSTKKKAGKKDKDAILAIFEKGLREGKTIKALCQEAECSNMYYNNNIKPLLK